MSGFFYIPSSSNFNSEDIFAFNRNWPIRVPYLDIRYRIFLVSLYSFR